MTLLPEIDMLVSLTFSPFFFYVFFSMSFSFPVVILSFYIVAYKSQSKIFSLGSWNGSFFSNIRNELKMLIFHGINVDPNTALRCRDLDSALKGFVFERNITKWGNSWFNYIFESEIFISPELNNGQKLVNPKFSDNQCISVRGSE